MPHWGGSPRRTHDLDSPGVGEVKEDDRAIALPPRPEPTDERLIGLSKRAFAGVAAKYEAALAKRHAEIQVVGAQAMRDLAAREAARSKAA
jgi:hypothetical protein